MNCMQFHPVSKDISWHSWSNAVKFLLNKCPSRWRTRKKNFLFLVEGPTIFCLSLEGLDSSEGHWKLQIEGLTSICYSWWFAASNKPAARRALWVVWSCPKAGFLHSTPSKIELFSFPAHHHHCPPPTQVPISQKVQFLYRNSLTPVGLKDPSTERSP